MSRLTIATSAQADASGGVVFDGFGAPGTGTAWVVTAAVPLAPGTASFQAWRTTEVWASWLGSAAGGPLLVTGSQRLVVKGTSLVDTVTYRCVLTGQSMPEATANGVSVAPISSSTLTKATFSGAVKITGPVSLASGSSVDVASGTIDLGAGTSVAINAGQLTSTTIPLQATAPQLLVTTFGTGATGTVTLTTSASITSTPNYKTLTLDAGVTLTAPWFIYANVEVTGPATAAIVNNGSNGSGKSGAAGGLIGSFFGGGAGGTGGSSVTNTKPGKAPPSASFQGGSGGPGIQFYGGENVIAGGTAVSPMATPVLFGTLKNVTLSGGGGGGGGGDGTTASKELGGGGGGGVVAVAAKKVSGALSIKATGGNGQKNVAYSGAGGGGIALLYSHTTKTWTGKVTINSGTTTTEPVAAGHTGSKTVRFKAVGAIFT